MRQQVLPKIQKINGWLLVNCISKNLPLRSQPVGATGQRLGAVGVVILNVLVEITGKICAIPFFIPDSSQPLWREELMNCGLLFGTNALVE